MSDYKVYSVHMGKAKCAVDLGDGSERGEYVDQDYILHKLGRPHRSISLMYCYYPLDKEFPGRISEVMKDADVKFQWDYPYDDYFTYKGGLEGNRDDEPFTCMRDIRRHGQDVTLTLTADPNISDEQIRAIAEDLRTFGRVFLRVNHENTGNWFSFNKRASYQEVADFYCKFVKIVHETAPNVQMILCTGGIEDPKSEKIVMEKEFAQSVKDTDIWSVDKYMALHWGWPFDVALRDQERKQYKRDKVEMTYNMTKRSYERFKVINGGVSKPMVMSEFNADGDVTGAYDQAVMVKDFCDMLKEDPELWFSGFTFYQFRDRGRLGLEIEDPNNQNVGIEQPVLKTYRELIHDDFFMPEMKRGGEVSFPAKLRWGNSEDAEGLEIPIHFYGDPHFCELTFEDESNLMIEINGKWFYKSPKAKVIDLMSAFYENRLEGDADLTLRIFAPPASGENDLSAEDGMFNSYQTIEKLPKIRIEYEPVVL
ncbi:hypothetical protein [Ruminococcus albus]|uniref:Uncharacterized protein n=1 Tax=Ruminococcus albus TaxID=1264 RepID=A0A1H7PF77_RUMAL|nr:hypothetical protein [Ruminococcus albus]SEL34084.1 hypothetical protein SAMN05216469_12111 [Ruminococcus albus]